MLSVWSVGHVLRNWKCSSIVCMLFASWDFLDFPCAIFYSLLPCIYTQRPWKTCLWSVQRVPEKIYWLVFLFSHLVSCVCVLGLENWPMSVSVLQLVLISYRLHIGVVRWWISVVTLVPLFDYACLYLHSYNSSLPNVIPICVDHTYFLLDAFLKKDWKGRCCRHCSQFQVTYTCRITSFFFRSLVFVSHARYVLLVSK